MESERVDGPRNSEGTYNNAQALMRRGKLELLRVQTHETSIRYIPKIRQMTDLSVSHVARGTMFATFYSARNIPDCRARVLTHAHTDAVLRR